MGFQDAKKLRFDSSSFMFSDLASSSNVKADLTKGNNLLYISVSFVSESKFRLYLYQFPFLHVEQKEL
jgi:hypothetical protein